MGSSIARPSLISGFELSFDLASLELPFEIWIDLVLLELPFEFQELGFHLI